MTKTHYDVLQIPRTASADDIKRGYRRMSSQLHPDKNPGRDTTAAMQEVNASYEFLSDRPRKSDYDFELAMDGVRESLAKLQRRPAQQPPVSPTASSHMSAAEFDVPDFDVPPKRTRKPKAKPEKATEQTAEQKQAGQQQSDIEALRSEVRRMCSIPPAPLSEAGVMATREWKKAAAKWHPFVSHPAVSIEILNAARRAMIEAAAAVPAH